MKVDTTLVAKKEIAAGTMQFDFARPEGFNYAAGQYADFFLIDPPETDGEGNIRSFSLVSAPHEEILSVATRLRDTAFKRVLRAAEPGLRLRIEGPMGSFTLHEKAARPAVFLIGGIGITPVFSILKDAIYRKLDHRLVLFYANRNPEASAFLPELQELSRNNPQFSLVGTMSDMASSQAHWPGATGYVTNELLDANLVGLHDPVYYISGPEAMVRSMRDILKARGISGDDIKTEEFSGY